MRDRGEKAERQRAAARQDWPVRRFRLGQEPDESLLSSTSVRERIDMMWPLAEQAWRLAGQSTERIPRAEMPVRCVKRTAAPR